MILKVLTNRRAKFEYVLEYMLGDKDRLYRAGDKPFVLTHNLKGNDISSWARQLRENEKRRTRKRRKDGIVLYHEVLAFSPADTRHITPQKLEDILRRYLHLRNPNGSYAVCVHRDREHIHAHICSSAIDRNGRNMRLSRVALSDLKKNIQQYQIEKYPELSRSVVRHGRKTKKRTSEQEQQYTLRTGKVSQREMVQRSVLACYQKAKSEEEFFALINREGMETYTRGGRVYGLVKDERKYRFKLLGIDIRAFSGQVASQNIGVKRIKNSRSR